MPCCQSSLQYSFWNSSASALSPKTVPTRCATADLASTRKPRHCASMSSLPCAMASKCDNAQGASGLLPTGAEALQHEAGRLMLAVRAVP